MSTQDKCCTIVPYFKVHSDKLADFQELCAKIVEKTQTEPKCLYYGYSFNNDQAYCREGYEDAGGLLAHLENVEPLLGKLFKISDIIRVEVHGPESELAKLRQPLAHLNPQFFILEYGFRR